MARAAVKVPVIAEFERAAAVVSEAASVTPLLRSNFLSGQVGADIHLKCENLQRTGAYKVRGAYYRMSKLSAEERARGVVAASAGNHAQGVALAAAKLGVRATVFMPVGASLPKYQATVDYGAEVVLEGAIFAETLLAAQSFAKSSHATFIPPYDHRDVVIGQGTVGIELLEQAPDLDCVIVPIGGGGLAAGVAVAAKLKAAEAGRKLKVIGVQAANAAAFPASLRAGEPTAVQVSPTIADGIAVSKPGAIPFALISEFVDKVVTVTEDEIAKAMLVMLERSKLVVEPAGVVGVAALLSGAVKAKGKVAVVLSGGNIDPLLLTKVIGHGLAASQRYTTISVMLPDRPGQLVRTAEAVASAHGNVVEVLHTRHGHGMQLNEVELRLSVETRGREHREQVLQALREAGLQPRIEAEDL